MSRLIEWGVGLDGLMRPMQGGGWAEKFAADELIKEMREALTLAKTEMIKSGNWYARDYGWPKACLMVEEAIAKAEPCSNPAPPATPPA